MSDKTPAPSLTVLCVGVALAATTLSGLVGALAAYVYHLEGPTRGTLTWVGVVAGVVGGLIGSIGWCGQMLRTARKYLRRTGRSSPWLIVHGTFDGFVAGLVAAGLLHATLMLVTGAWNGEAALMGFLGASILGLGLGFVSGLLAWGAAALAAPPSQRPAAEPPP